MPSRLANSWSDRARPLTSSSNHARPRAIALISAGSHLELFFCGANPGRTNLVSAPRRVKAAVAVRSTEQFTKLVARHAGRSKPLDQARRAGQGVGQDPDHRLLDLPGGEPPAFAIRSGIGDQCRGDVEAIASALLGRA